MARTSNWLPFPTGLRGRSGAERGVVGVNLVLVVSFALYAVIMLSSTTLSAKQIDDHVKVIVTEVGPGSNVSRLDETQKLNTIGKTAEDILAAARPLSGQAQQVIVAATSIDNTVSAIQANANEINATVHSINNTASALLPVVQTIHGDGSDNVLTGGVDLINRQAGPGPNFSGLTNGADTISGPPANVVVGNISSDLGDANQVLGTAGLGGHQPLQAVHAHVNSIDCSINTNGLLGIVGALLPPPYPSCNIV
ncbi:MAG: hypothetical protein ACRD12_13395 [Acidimicrobiales bacterium]